MSGKTFLLIDDDELQRKCISNLCKKFGIAVEVAEGTSSALSIINAKNQEFDACLIDLYMPEENGDITIQKLKEAGAQVKFYVLLSGGKFKSI